jgi:probable O-glycosylation ligase (exosortase A-associated)
MKVILTLFFAPFALFGWIQPWLWVVAAYVIAILHPQSVWFWHFGDFRAALFVTLPLLVSVFIAGLRGRLCWRALKSTRAACIALLLLACAMSALFAPYAEATHEAAIQGKWYILEITAKIVLMMAIASLCVTQTRPIRVLGWMVAGIGVYLVYWANAKYLAAGWVYRLSGPATLGGNGPYVDANNFAAFFVASLPFIWYMGFTLKHPALRAALWLVVPFGWHALFLTGSRGGLLGMVAVLGLIVLRSGQRRYGVLLIAAFVGAFVWQAGDTMKERTSTIDNYQQDDSAADRIVAWVAAMRMIIANPLTGVGPGAFLKAFPEYSDGVVIQAHNTYFQIGAEYGPIAAIALLGAIVSCLLALYRRGRVLQRLPESPDRTMLRAVNEATLTGLFGLFVCSMFLTLQLFEFLFFLIFLANAVEFVSRSHLSAAGAKSNPGATVVGDASRGAGGSGLPIPHRSRRTDPARVDAAVRGKDAEGRPPSRRGDANHGPRDGRAGQRMTRPNPARGERG